MKKVEVFKTFGPEANLFPLGPDRDWMPENKFAYSCPPVTLSNRLGYGVSFNRDISFIWNGSSKAGEDGDIEVLEGKEYCVFGRGGGIIGFPTNLIFKTDKDTSIMVMPVPNQFIDGVQCFTSVISSSFYTGALHIVWKVINPGKVITIPAQTPLGAILPISLKDIQDSTMIMKDGGLELFHGKEYTDAMLEYAKKEKRLTNWYRNATDHLGNKIGEHEITKLRLNVEREHL